MKNKKLYSKLLMAVLLSVISGLLFIVALPPGKLWPLVFVVLVPSIVAQYCILPKKYSSIAPAVHTGTWLGIYFYRMFAGMGTYMTYLPFILFALVYFLERGTREFHEKSNFKMFVLRESFSWVGVDFLRSFVPFMGTWGFVGYALYQQVNLIAPVSVFGVLGASLLVMAVNYLIGHFAIVLYKKYQTDEGKTDKNLMTPGLKNSLIATSVVVGVWFVSVLVVRTVHNAQKDSVDTVGVAAISVQERNDEGGYYSDEEIREDIEETLIENSYRASERGAKIIVWPEGALNYDPREEKSERFKALAAETESYIVIGYMVGKDDGTWRNEAVILSPEGEFSESYGKEHPVVFGGEVNTGLGRYPVVDTPYGKLGVIICYDQDFTDSTRFAVQNGAQIIAVPSLDWPAIAHSHYAHTVFRAAENKVSLIKADGGYDSVLVNPDGEVIESLISEEPKTGIVYDKIEVRESGTLNTVLGDWIGWLGVVSFVVFAVIEKKNEKKNNK